MRLLTDQERIALRELGPPDEGPVSEETFASCIAMGWGYWAPDPYEPGTLWFVTAAGRRALVGVHRFNQPLHELPNPRSVFEQR